MSTVSEMISMNNLNTPIKTKLQAHKGVASECPENTMSAFRCAAVQGYDVIELDLEYTSDEKIVVMHDSYLNRTARNADGSELGERVCIHDITYDDALRYDFGVGFSKKYAGERIPLFGDVLEFASENGIRLKIDNKIQGFPEHMQRLFFDMIKSFSALVSVTSNSLDFVKICLEKVPGVSIDYDGEVTEEKLRSLTELLPYDRLTVWLPYECGGTSWVKIPFADEKLSETVKSCARLGIWIISDENDFENAMKRFSPYIVETDGRIKPYRNAGKRFDMHTHSQNSHDSVCPVADMAVKAKERGLSGFAVTDHVDIEYCHEVDIDKVISGSHAEAAEVENNTGMPIFRGAEFCEMFWYPDVAERLMHDYKYDVVVGSVHAVKYEGRDMPYSKIVFSEIDREMIYDYMDCYFDDMLRMIREHDFDILAHMTCPLRYINGKYHCGVTLERYEDKIKTILAEIIKRGIALEVNTSCVSEGSGYCEFLPNEHIVKLYRSMGGYLVTTASDAHIAENCANAFDKVYDFLRETGFKNVYYYKNRCAVQCAL